MSEPAVEPVIAHAVAAMAAQAAGAAEQVLGRATPPRCATSGFPYRRADGAAGRRGAGEPPSLGADYDTEWARSPVARAARRLIVAGPQRLLIDWVADPEIRGHDRLADLARRADGDGDPPAVIFAPNHHSHLDTALMVRGVPAAWRAHLVTAAAADYFFDKRWKATLAALALNAIPVDREVTGRRSADLMARADRRRLEPRHLPRGRALAGRLGPDVQGRRRLPRRAHRRAGRAGVHRRHRLDHGQGHERAQARAHPGDVRQPAAPPSPRSRRAASTSASSGPSPRSPTSRPPTTGRLGAGRPRRDPVADGPGLHRLAAPLGRSPTRRRRGIAGWRNPPTAPLARPLTADTRRPGGAASAEASSPAGSGAARVALERSTSLPTANQPSSPHGTRMSAPTMKAL